MQPMYIKTPLIRSSLLKQSLNKHIDFKLELLQPTGSFKIRGIGQLCQEEFQKGAKSFVASSGGNAGIAVAYCGMKLNIPATIFIPSTSHPQYINALKTFGAKVIIQGSVWDEAHQAALEFSRNHEAAYIPPFDHSSIWQGHSTMIDEIVMQQSQKPDAVIVSVGGGGLACGILEGMHRHGWKAVPLIAVETHGADAFFQSVRANKVVTLDSITSKATSLGAKRITEQLFQWSKKHPIENIVVSDEKAELGSREFAKQQRMLVEISSGASLAVVYQNHPIIHQLNHLLVIVCGGVNISHFQLD